MLYIWYTIASILALHSKRPLSHIGEEFFLFFLCVYLTVTASKLYVTSNLIIAYPFSEMREVIFPKSKSG